MLRPSGTYKSLQANPQQHHFELRIDAVPDITNTTEEDALKIKDASFDVFLFNDVAINHLTYLYSATMREITCRQISPNDLELTAWTTVSNSDQRPAKTRVQIREVHGAYYAFMTIAWPDSPEETIGCQRESRNFRKVDLEIDVCDTVQREAVLPSLHTSAITVKPPDFVDRRLDLAACFKEAGIDLRIHQSDERIQDSREKWSDAELHDLMEASFEAMRDNPQWYAWGLATNHHEEDSYKGVMFDTNAQNGGLRQGFAVFLGQDRFKDLDSQVEERQIEAQREYLHTWVHELGHVFNLGHLMRGSSWMHVPKLDQFWENFMFSFTSNELTHLRHAHRQDVIMGSQNSFSHDHSHHNASHAHASSEFREVAEMFHGNAFQVELLLRSKQFYAFMEPVHIEVRLKSLSREGKIDVPLRLNPANQNLRLFIKGPKGLVRQYQPLTKILSISDTVSLDAMAEEGRDRISSELFIHYGKDGFYFDEPGSYELVAVYHEHHRLIPSNSIKIRVKAPQTAEEEMLASDFFTVQVGTSLYLNGSESERLSKGLDTLREAAELFPDQLLGIRAKAVLSQSLASSHKYCKVDRRSGKRKLYRSRAKNIEAIKVSKEIPNFFSNCKDKYLNLAYANLLEQRLELLRKHSDPAKAEREQKQLISNLKQRGVNKPVIDQLNAECHANTKSKPPPRRAKA